MPKRQRSVQECHGPFKRSRVTVGKVLLDLSDELLLKILSCLSVGDLVTTASVSRQFRRLSDDSELWKQKYHQRWVQPRARWIPHAKKSSREGDNAPYSSEGAQWPGQRRMISRGKNTGWKQRYRIRHNWWRGSCQLHDFELGQPSAPAMLVQSHHDLIFTADSLHGLRAWSPKSKREPLAVLKDTGMGCAGALKVDTTLQATPRLAIGYDSGMFVVVDFHQSSGFSETYSNGNTTSGPIDAFAIASPYILAKTRDGSLNLYCSQLLGDDTVATGISDTLSPLASLKSDSTHAPVAMSLRKHAQGVTACMAYALPRLKGSWHIGLQEVRMSANGKLLESRMASTIDSPPNLVSTTLPLANHASLLQHISLRPDSLSYSHPFLLATLPNNTFRVHLVTSDTQKLHISTGRTMYGHTSGISAAEINDRGKAVSVSMNGDEIRVWEMEQAMASTEINGTSTRVFAPPSIAFVARRFFRGEGGIELAVKELRRELASKRILIGFDDEQVLVLQVPTDNCDRQQILSCYDFT